MGPEQQMREKREAGAVIESEWGLETQGPCLRVLLLSVMLMMSMLALRVECGCAATSNRNAAKQGKTAAGKQNDRVHARVHHRSAV